MKRRHRNDRGDHRQKRTILVVDDDSAILALCGRVLRGYRVLQARNCTEALKMFENEAVDLVLTDAKIPGECGIDLLRRIKGLQPDALVIIMSACADQETVLRSLREGVDDFICKQFIQLQLRESIEKVLFRKILRAEAADKKRLECLRSGFLSLISHKLRTPITNISLILEYLDQSVCGSGANGCRQAIATAGEEASYLGRLVDELLLFSQVMGGEEVRPEKVDLVSLVANALQESPESQAKPGVETFFEPSTLESLNLDLRKIAFALQQVIDNAYKFSPEPGRVSVALCQGNGEIKIVVVDSGSGIPREEQEKVFDKFYQVDPDGTGQVRGLGLGLFYAREYVLLHGGAITLESEPGSGTTVTIVLPLQ